MIVLSEKKRKELFKKWCRELDMVWVELGYKKLKKAKKKKKEEVKIEIKEDKGGKDE